MISYCLFKWMPDYDHRIWHWLVYLIEIIVCCVLPHYIMIYHQEMIYFLIWLHHPKQKYYCKSYAEEYMDQHQSEIHWTILSFLLIHRWMMVVDNIDYQNHNLYHWILRFFCLCWLPVRFSYSVFQLPMTKVIRLLLG